MGLLSQVFDLAPTEHSSADPQKEPISVEITDASTAAENVSFILDACWSIFFNFLIYSVFHPSSNFLPCQILSEETYTQEQELDNPLNDPIGVEGDLVVVGPQIIDSPVWHITEGKEVTCPFYSSAIIMK